MKNFKWISQSQSYILSLGIKQLFAASFCFCLYCLILLIFVVASASSSGYDLGQAARRNIFVLYSLDLPDPLEQVKSNGHSDTMTYASPYGPNPKYVAEIIAWELREEGKVLVKEFHEINDLDELLNQDVIIIGSNSKDGKISPTTRSLLDELQTPSSKKRRAKLRNKIVSCFINSDQYRGSEEGLDFMIYELGRFDTVIVPGLIITEAMDYTDAAENIRFYAATIKKAIKEYYPSESPRTRKAPRSSNPPETHLQSFQ
jgi:flavodoxin